MLPSAGHAKRMCRIMRLEMWKQVGWYRDCLRMWCHQSSPNERSAERAYGEHLRLASEVTEFMWESLRATLPKKEKVCAPAPSPVLFLGKASAPRSVTDVLQGGHKYSLPPNPNPIEKLCIARALADRVRPEERERCISEAVDVLRCKSGGQKKAPRTGPVVSYFQENKLKLLTADKEGGFVVIPEGLFGEKSRAAIQKNFRQFENVSLNKIKTAAKQLCESLELNSLAKGFRLPRSLAWKCFFHC
ncbi:hypothetical protein ISCGN_011668 [Ixodes scapularis]